jgi:hypothetical protein
MVTQTQRRALSLRPTSGWWWIALLTTVLFAFQINYIRIHLLTEVHHRGDGAAGHHHAGDHHHSAEAENDHHHDHHHQPHSADDHELQLTGKRPLPTDTIALLLPETSFYLSPPNLLLIDSQLERDGIPGESPPDPRQPRAPPNV